ncbi:hypothetical protein [Mariniphaga sediminis]|nr:hypothetical protein [Mariniphaga sediminis]
MTRFETVSPDWGMGSAISNRRQSCHEYNRPTRLDSLQLSE